MNRVYFKDVVKKRRDKIVYEAVFALGTLQKKLLELIDEPMWRSQDGRVLPARAMRSRHLRNVVALLEREDETGDVFYFAAIDELARRDEDVMRSIKSSNERYLAQQNSKKSYG